MNSRLKKTGSAAVLALILTAAAGQVACAEPAAPQQRGAQHRPGLGQSTQPPEGTPFTLPEGLELENPIHGYSPEDPYECDDIYGDDAYGHGALVQLCLIFRNRTNRPITVTLPPGLIFVSNSVQRQNGILTQTIAFEVPAGERFFAPIIMYCINSPRMPSGQGEYQVGPVTEYADFRELFTLLEGRDISPEEAGDIQVALQHLQEGKGLSANDRRVIAGM